MDCPRKVFPVPIRALSRMADGQEEGQRSLHTLASVHLHLSRVDRHVLLRGRVLGVNACLMCELLPHVCTRAPAPGQLANI